MISEILRTTGNYTQDEVRLFESTVTLRTIGKNEVLLKKGEISKSIYYLIRGAVYQYDFIRDSHISVNDLHVENEWFTNYQSLIPQTPSESYIQAFSDGQILEISLDAVHYLISKSITFLHLNKILAGSVERKRLFDLANSPSEKYEYILNNRPRLLQDFPLKMVSSYLKLTPETLSRVRKSIGRGRIS